MYGALPLAHRSLAAGPRFPRPFKIAAVLGEYGWAAWSYSRQAKLNAWSWHGIGPLGSINSWATLGNALYIRGEGDSLVYVMQPDTFYAATDSNTESTSVEATTQWVDMGKPTVMKALTGIDADCKNITAIEVYVSVDGDRAGTLSETVQIGSNQGGWTYSGEIIPLCTTSTEFKLRFIADGNLEAQVNRVTLHWSEIAG